MGHPPYLLQYGRTLTRWAKIWEQKDCLCYKNPDGSPISQYDYDTRRFYDVECSYYPGPG